jgi:hypothetical protein
MARAEWSRPKSDCPRSTEDVSSMFITALRGRAMTMRSKAAHIASASKPFFKCPHCSALYHIIKVEAGPESDDREITCRTCGGPLRPREGKFIFKYFLLRDAGRRQTWKRTQRTID